MQTKTNYLNLTVLEGVVREIFYNPITPTTHLAVSDSKQSVKCFNVITNYHLAETCNKYLTKGSHVLITGYLKNHSGLNALHAREVRFLPPIRN